MRPNRLAFLASCVVGITSALPAPAGAAGDPQKKSDVQVVVYTGQPVPGADGTRFVVPPTSLDGSLNFLVSPAGRVVFGANFTGAGGNVGGADVYGTTSSLWAWEKGRLTPIARAGDPMPGGGTFTSFAGLPDGNRPGQVAFVGTGAGESNGVFLASPQGRNGPYSVANVLRSDDALGTETVGRVAEAVVLNDAGETSFAASLRSQERSGGYTYLTTAGGGISPLVRAGSRDPGVVNAEAAFVYGIDRRGRTTFLPYGRGLGAGGIYHGTPGDLRPAAPSGSPAPGTDGDTFAGYTAPGVSRNGVLAVSALTTRSHGVWVGDENGLELLALRGTPAPGVAEGVFGGFAGINRVNDHGEVAFVGRVDYFKSYYGIWAGTPGHLEKVITEGDLLPGTNDRLTRLPYPNPHLSDRGDVAFLGLRGDGPFPNDNGGDGIWAGRPGHLSLIAEQGDVVALDDGLEKTIDRLFFPYHYRGGRMASTFSDDNELLFQARFTDGTYALLTSTVHNPEPSGALLLCAIGAAASLRRRREPSAQAGTSLA